MKLKIFLMAITAIGLLANCDNNDDGSEEDNCVDNGIEFVTAVDAPTTGEVNKTVEIDVTFSVKNGCGEFGGFIESEDGNKRTIEVEATYTGCVCTLELKEYTVTYEFMAESAGEYELNFKSGESEFITVNLTIN